MLEKVDIKTAVPKGGNVLVHIRKMPKTTDAGIFLGNTNEFSSSKLDIDNYTAEIVSVGSEVDKEEFKAGEKVMFSQFSGYHVPSGREVFAKLIPFTDIHCKIEDDMNFKLEEVNPVGPRLLVEVVVPDEIKTDAGIVLSKPTEEDPRQLDSLKCIVRGIGAEVKDNYTIGDTVYIPTYVGNEIILDDGRMLKTINFNDVLFAVK